MDFKGWDFQSTGAVLSILAVVLERSAKMATTHGPAIGTNISCSFAQNFMPNQSTGDMSSDPPSAAKCFSGGQWQSSLSMWVFPVEPVKGGLTPFPHQSTWSHTWAQGDCGCRPSFPPL